MTRARRSATLLEVLAEGGIVGERVVDDHYLATPLALDLLALVAEDLDERYATLELGMVRARVEPLNVRLALRMVLLAHCDSSLFLGIADHHEQESTRVRRNTCSPVAKAKAAPALRPGR